uniref:CSON004546 protein n=1 Tax=Culicoides sonorensis TaxID=179676 RepID=A0A336LYR8_CULSO
MKYAIAFVCLIVAVNACVPDDTDGRPLCNDETTLVGQNYRNNFDPNLYWNCASLNNAVSVKCPTEAPLYYVVQDKCVTSGVWRWTPPCKPDA